LHSIMGDNERQHNGSIFMVFRTLGIALFDGKSQPPTKKKFFEYIWVVLRI